MEKNLSVTNRQGAKQLLFTIIDERGNAGNTLDYDSLMNKIRETPELLLRAENITWQPPLGFIITNSQGKHIDYLDMIFPPEGPEPEDVRYVSTNGPDDFPILIETLLSYPFAFANYSEEYHAVATGQAIGFEMAKIEGFDLFVYNPDFAAEPFVLRRGSTVPAGLIEGAVLMMKGKRNSEQDMEKFLKDIVQLQNN